MTFFAELQNSTRDDRQYLLDTPLIRQSLAGDISRDTYAAFLCQAFHHVRHTVPLLMAAGSRVPDNREWVRTALADYITEEIGHEEWILNDIAACGYDREAARRSRPNTATELMVAYAYDSIQRISPLALFGMVLVLEGTSIDKAISAADGIQRALGLPDTAFSYLRSHGALDQEHMAFFEVLMNRIEDRSEQQIIIHAARMFYRLYGDVFRSVAATQAHALRPAEPELTATEKLAS